MSKTSQRKFCRKVKSNEAYMIGFNKALSDKYYKHNYTSEEWNTILQNHNSYFLGRKHGFKKRTHEIYKKLCQKLCVYLISAITAVVFCIATLPIDK